MKNITISDTRGKLPTKTYLVEDDESPYELCDRYAAENGLPAYRTGKDRMSVYYGRFFVKESNV